MYRLKNLGIEAKIDWLIQNRGLATKKIVILPWKKEGLEIKSYLNMKWGVQEFWIIDDFVAQYNREVRGFEALKDLRPIEDYVFLVADNTVYDILARLDEYSVPDENIYILKGEPLRAQDALIKCCEDRTIGTVLDVGCGKGIHAGIFCEYGKTVTGIESGYTCRIKKQPKFSIINDDFIKHKFSENDRFDLIWCSHVLEHQLDTGAFIKKLFECCAEGGKVAITVPADMSGMVMEGHVSFWNAGLLMYNIIQSGYSCRNAAVKTYAQNVSVIVPKEKIIREGDYRKEADSTTYFPCNMKCGRNKFGGVYFDGNIEELNWEE